MHTRREAMGAATRKCLRDASAWPGGCKEPRAIVGIIDRRGDDPLGEAAVADVIQQALELLHAPDGVLPVATPPDVALKATVPRPADARVGHAAARDGAGEQDLHL